MENPIDKLISTNIPTNYATHFPCTHIIGLNIETACVVSRAEARPAGPGRAVKNRQVLSSNHEA